MNKFIIILVFNCFVSLLFGRSKNENGDIEIIKINEVKSVNTVDSIKYSDIYSILNSEIVLNDTWAGQSLTLVYENENYYI